MELFLKIGLDNKTARKTIDDNELTSDLTAIIYEAGVCDGCDKTTGNLLYSVATRLPISARMHHSKLIKCIMSFKLPAQRNAAIKYFEDIESKDFNMNEFEEACGVGVEVLAEDIEKTVSKIFEENMNSILEKRYRTSEGKLLGDVLKKLPWADPRIVQKVIGEKMYELLGERTAADNEKPVKKKEKKEKPAKVEKAPAEVASKPSEEELNSFSIFPKPEHNIKVHTEVSFSDGSVLRYSNTRELLDKHLKAMYVNFGLAKDRGGCCYLRFDDTNPEAEKSEYITHIEEIVNWMGWKPFKLYDLAVELIRRGHAYVDHQTGEEVKEYREKKMNSPWRDRPIEESLKLFDEMKRGLFEEGKATLRMKMNMQNDNFNIYDYAHCIVDSLENITHSLCTLEFETRRASYYWLLHSLGLYMPHVWEYSRLNITNTMMSKHKLNQIVTDKHVDGWDDPRLMTLAGLRRRGVTPTAINDFIKGIGITRSDGSIINMNRLESHIRVELHETAPRTMVVVHPLKVVITNMESDKVIELDAKIWPENKSNDPSSFYKVPFSRVVYIERGDFRLKDSKDYYGLAPGKTVMLRHGFPIKCTDVVLADDNETVVEIHAEYDPEKKTIPKKGFLHWVAEPAPGKEPLKVEVRLFDKLFYSENPGELENWLDDINTNSRLVVSDAFAVPTLKEAALGEKFQFERLGYFVVDKDSTPEKLVFNRTVTLKESSSKPGK
ncbi:predicted protein [Arabidopsis lyrata subsp. lyrata]|uniref:glutamine--tRNA ligase n=1 Tax=Arabidopsis lyrata subsp. lyrata TaxID=81972 RepID=D7KWA6_ARALL|nr:predicted protein [Arabidopsis lyrata subsp. lyrata]